MIKQKTKKIQGFFEIAQACFHAQYSCYKGDVYVMKNQGVFQVKCDSGIPILGTS